MVPEGDGIAPAFDRVATVDVDGQWLWVAPMTNVPMALIRLYVCQVNLILYMLGLEQMGGYF